MEWSPDGMSWTEATAEDDAFSLSVTGEGESTTIWVRVRAWVPKGVERPAAIYIIRLGGNIAKLLASALTRATLSPADTLRA